MKIISSLLVLACLLAGCNQNKDLSEVLEVKFEMADLEECFIDDISSKVECYNLTLPENYFFGDITEVKTFGDSLLFFHDYYNKQIHIFSREGKLINFLDKQGRGPGEYIDIEFFIINEWEAQLVVYDHSGKKLIYYTIPELSYIKSQKLNNSLMSAAFISNSKLLFISDDDKMKTSTETTCVGVGEYDLQKNRFQSYHLDNLLFSICLSYPRTISYVDRVCYYAYPDDNSVIYKVIANKGLEPFVKFNFINKNGNKEFWKCNDLNKCNENIMEQDVALMPHYFTFTQNFFSFFFLYKDLRNTCFALSDRNKEKNRVFKNIKIHGVQIPHLNPVGLCDGAYIFLVYPHECIFDQEEIMKSSISQQIADKIKNASDEGTPVLLMLKPALQ